MPGEVYTSRPPPALGRFGRLSRFGCRGVSTAEVVEPHRQSPGPIGGAPQPSATTKFEGERLGCCYRHAPGPAISIARKSLCKKFRHPAQPDLTEPRPPPFQAKPGLSHKPLPGFGACAAKPGLVPILLDEFGSALSGAGSAPSMNLWVVAAEWPRVRSSAEASDFCTACVFVARSDQLRHTQRSRVKALAMPFLRAREHRLISWRCEL